ncbi:MAG: 50S ribosomal protein L23 [Polyangiaceae bacterium]|nr:50S ribosomal protein L23 [Polyangiaceae bacterium]
MSPEHILRRPIALTEKATRLRNENKVVFEVATTANKVQIRHAVEVMFKVKVTSVNTSLVRGKDRRMGRGHARTQNWKKAVVSLAEGHAIDFFADETK